MALLPDPVRLLNEAASRSAEAALALAGRERVRLAVTGLSRAGKTVFLTSLVANLVAAGAGRRTLPGLDLGEGRLRRARAIPPGVEATPRFDAEAHLAALAADPPEWPARTEDLSTLSLSLTLRRHGLYGQFLPDREVTLDLLDYPGEWLLDLPMFLQDFAAWSDETLARLSTGIRAAPAAEFLAFARALPANAPAEDSLARRGHALYRRFLLAARDELGLRFLQPGRFLNPGPAGDAPLLWFFPLPEAARGSPLGELLERRHAAYLRDQRDRFLDPVFRRFDRQVVLVDVLGALHAGREAFDDTAEALAAISGTLRYGRGWLDLLTGGGIGRVAFAATKADHVPEVSRDSLSSLLSDLVDAPRRRAEIAGAAVSVHAVAAIRCTQEATATHDGRPSPAVRGVLLENGRWATVDPGLVPARRPPESFWHAPYFQMPVFRPPGLDADGRGGVPHLGLDALLAGLLGDAL
ncbi:ATPase [Roseomonas nepalensis]|uniref:ATPase n=1 Tax=Muricoccus nepalensis TaxID=1854500 RepID=A0A502GK82_9PROT|nr:YcjX family protein [Roseomonas nepalensis]TPG61233.1 ATPase [Roseomonas nepalensis]